MIYLDYAATTPLLPSARAETEKVIDNYWVNPASLYSEAYKARKLLDNYRERIATCINSDDPMQIFFTSGASESNSWALESLAQHSAAIGRFHIISSKAEHLSILNKLKELETRGFTISYIEDFKGESLVSKVKNAITFNKENKCQTGFITLMKVNNETGKISNFDNLYPYCRKYKILFHSDITQAIPHIAINCKEYDMVSCSAHKFGGPRGVGFLFSKHSSILKPLIFGGKQEFGLRGGTTNLPGIGGMTVALENTTFKDSIDVMASKDYFMRFLKSEIPEIQFHSEVNEIPTINFYIPEISSEMLTSMLGMHEIYVSTASACSSGQSAPSHVLKALGLSDEVAANSIRVSYDKFCDDEIQFFVKTLKDCVDFIRGK